MFSRVLLVSLLVRCCFASIDFTYSTMYDINDFVGQKEVVLSKCTNGCLIYASTTGDGFAESPSNYDPYAENLIIHDNTQNKDLMSITDLSRKFENNLQKTPLSFTGPASISILNKNVNDDYYWPIVLYVLENNQNVKFTYQMFDALTVQGLTVNAGTTTVMSASPFSLSARKNDARNGVTARLTGPDNVLDDNVDDCVLAYRVKAQNTFAGFALNIAGPIISLSFSGAVLDAELQFIPVFDLSSEGFITSAGYNGCKKPNSGGVQSFRTSLLKTTDIYSLTSDSDKYNVFIDVFPNLSDIHEITVNDIINNNVQKVSGYTEKDLQFTNTDFVEIVFDKLYGDQGFLARYSAQALDRSTTKPAPTKEPSQTDSTTAAQDITTSSGIQRNTLLSAIAAKIVSRI